ncbi:MAG: hypothetical protein ISR73_01550, partial [Gammaproteobacteria bacterium]|nr:hypothetical protein [Gammaproteobacteria bacterium]
YGKRPYEPLLYRRLGELYTRQERFSDASDIYLWFGEFYPFSRYTPLFHDRAIVSLQKAGFASSILPEKERFVKLYNIGTPFWRQQDLDSQGSLKPRLAVHLYDIATHYHAVAGKTGNIEDYAVAASWYKLHLKSFPQHSDASRINFLLAETLYEATQYEEAILEYEKTAYEYATHKHSAEAGFAVFYAYDRLYQQTALEKKSLVNQRLIKSSLLYSDRFSYDTRMPAILIKTAENFYALKEYLKALEVTQLLVTNPSLDRSTHHRAWVVMGHSAYAEKRYDLAEQAYSESIKTRPRDAKEELNLDEQLAQSIYRQGEQARTQGKHSEAALHFIRVAKLVPDSPTRIIADYDAATEYTTLQHWPAAIVLLERFRIHHKDQGKWELGVTEKLALAYSSSGKHLNAAEELLKLVKTRPPEQQQDLLWQAAEHYTQAGEEARAIEIYKTYILQFPYPLARSIELRHKIAQFYATKGNTREHHHWLSEIISADAAAKDRSNERSRYLAALASLELTTPLHKSYSNASLTAPLKKSLAIKKNLMKSAIDAYSAAARYQVEEVTTAATFNLAEIYREFASALLKSERPNKLNAEELEEYNYLLEDQAYPFEEKSIQIHESNLARIPAGSFDASIRKSLQALGKLLPFRYAKNEMTESYAD